MHWTTHVITGAAFGYLFESPTAAALAGLGSHLLLDVAPHHDPDTEIGYVVDSLLGGAALLYLAQAKRARSFDTRKAALWGAIGNAAPDSELLIKLVKHVEDHQLFFPTHNTTLPHSETNLLISTVSQFFLIAVSLILAFLKWQRKSVKPGEASGGFAG